MRTIGQRFASCDEDASSDGGIQGDDLDQLVRTWFGCFPGIRSQMDSSLKRWNGLGQRTWSWLEDTVR
jgi:hypothetical protein